LKTFPLKWLPGAGKRPRLCLELLGCAVDEQNKLLP
jgi:hypothetical protein